MKERTLEIELHKHGGYPGDTNDYRLYVDDELILERPYRVPPGYAHQVAQIKCMLDSGSHVVRLENITGELVLGTILCNKKKIAHTNGYFEL